MHIRTQDVSSYIHIVLIFVEPSSAPVTRQILKGIAEAEHFHYLLLLKKNITVDGPQSSFWHAFMQIFS